MWNFILHITYWPRFDFSIQGQLCYAMQNRVSLRLYELASTKAHFSPDKFVRSTSGQHYSSFFNSTPVKHVDGTTGDEEGPENAH